MIESYPTYEDAVYAQAQKNTPEAWAIQHRPQLKQTRLIPISYRRRRNTDKRGLK